MSNSGASAKAEQALVASDQAASRLAPTGFDPSRIDLGPSAEWSDKLAELYEWSGSKHAEQHPELYSFLCSLIGYLVAAEAAAIAMETQRAEAENTGSVAKP